MVLYLLRHADAEPQSSSDAARRLTKKGEAQAACVARFCEAHGLLPSLVLTSPMARAEQTAQAVASQTHRKLQVAPWLESGMSPETALLEMPIHRELESVMLVGHEPDLSLLIATLLGLPSAQQLLIRKASLTALELHRWRPAAAQLLFSLPCKLM